MRHSTAVLLGLLLSLQGFGAPVKDSLLVAHAELQDLAVDLPFDRAHPDWREKVRENFRTALRNLQTAAGQVERSAATATPMIEEGLALLRLVGLLLPFSEIDKTKIDGILSRYNGAQDTVTTALRTLTTTPAPTPVCPKPTTPAKVWKYGDVHWVFLPGLKTQREAFEECRDVVTSGGLTWRLPTFAELAGAFRRMRDPRWNTVFGSAASTWHEVWTGELYGPGEYYVIDFHEDKSGTARRERQLPAVCVGR